MNAGERPKETAEVVALQNYLTECKEERIVKLKDEIKKAAERVIFLLYHAKLDGKSPLKKCFCILLYRKYVMPLFQFTFHRNTIISFRHLQSLLMNDVWQNRQIQRKYTLFSAIRAATDTKSSKQ